MLNVLKQLRVFRTVRIVAGPAVHGRPLDVQMIICKFLTLQVVTVAAQRGNRLRQQGRFLRDMGLMTPQTVSLCRGMMDHALCHLCFNFLMTGQA